MLAACSSKPEPNLELFSPEAFAYDLGDYWEINVSVNAKGFEQKEINGKYSFSLKYLVNIVTPESDTLFNIFDKEIEKEETEEITELQLEAQIEVDSTFTKGNYILIFNVYDEFSKQDKSVNINLELSE